MDYSIKNTTREQRAELVKKALAISLSGADMPTDETIKLAKKNIFLKIFLIGLEGLGLYRLRR